MTTGINRVISERWLKTLREKGEYLGDVTIVDYGRVSQFGELDPDNSMRVKELINQGAIVYPTEPKLGDWYLDRMRAYREYLLKDDNYKKYDVVMFTDGNDVVFHGSIQPLLEQGEKTLCYVKEPDAYKLKTWQGFIVPNILRDYDSIADEIIINGGMVVGPTRCVLDLLNWEMDMNEKFKNPPICDQVFLNIFIYYNKYQPSLEVGREWNYLRTHGRPIIKDGKAFSEDGKPIMIEHRVSTGSWFWLTPKGKSMIINGGVTLNAEYDEMDNKLSTWKERTLIMTTGMNGVILNRWLPLLRSNGCYDGEVLIADYGSINYGHASDPNKKYLTDELMKQKNVTVLQCQQLEQPIFNDRIRVYFEYLKENDRWKNYDTIMIVDSNDIIFWGSIQPLLEMGRKELCYVKEQPANILDKWDDFNSRQFVRDEYWSISHNRLINGGMIIGPSKTIMDLLSLERDMMKKYADSKLGFTVGQAPCDQVYLNILIYFFKYPSREVGDEWNYTHVLIGGNPRYPIYKDGKAFKREDGTPVIIEHRTGTSYWFWQSNQGLALLNSKKHIPINAEYEIPYSPNEYRMGPHPPFNQL